MTTHEFNQNILFSKDETYQALVSHFNQIAESGKNKRFEWEDENLTETHNITFDFDEWFDQLEINVNRDYYELNDLEAPKNLRNDLMNYANQLKDYVDGFVLAPVGMYKGKTFMVEVCGKYTFDKIVEHMKEVRQNNQMVFLYQVFEQPKRPKEIVLDGVTYPQDLSKYYTVRYGVLNG